LKRIESPAPALDDLVYPLERFSVGEQIGLVTAAP